MIKFNKETRMFELWAKENILTAVFTPDEWFDVERTIEMADEEYFSTVEYVDVECMNCGMVLGAVEDTGPTFVRPEHLCVACSKETTVEKIKAEMEAIELNG